MRTYSGHTSAAASNELFRRNLSRGQTGLSIAFDLPTQIGYDADHPLAAGEVGRVGVPVAHLGDLEALLTEIPLERMNTSMTINATAGWLLALYVALAEKRGIERKKLAGTVQNDILKEYLARGTWAFPPKAGLALSAEVIAWAVRELPEWNPINVCSYHLQEAGATPVMELGFTLANAQAVLDAVKAKGTSMPPVVGRVSFFCNAGIRFVEELCKMRAFVGLWDEIARSRYGVEDPVQRRFRYGLQVNSLGLTERQPENNVVRIILEMLGAALSRDARARAIQLPCWNEALGLPRPWDQQWSLRMQQVLAYETDLLEYPDLFAGSKVVEALTARLVQEATAEIKRVEALGGSLHAVESGWMKSRLVAANAERLGAIERGDKVLVGVNRFEEGAPSPLMADEDGGILTVDPSAEREQVERLRAWMRGRDEAAVRTALATLKEAASREDGVMECSIQAAKAGVTTGEWAAALRAVFGDYRAPTGISGGTGQPAGESLAVARARVDALAKRIGRRPRLLVGKPGLDGHSNGAEQVAVEARDAGFEVVYLGIRLTPAEIVSASVQEGVDAVGLSILSGGHMTLVPAVMEGLSRSGVSVPVIVGGIIPDRDRERLLSMGVARVFTPQDFDRGKVMQEIAEVLSRSVASQPVVSF